MGSRAGEIHSMTKSETLNPSASHIAARPAIRTVARQVEIAWFSALCADDYEFLGVPEGRLRSSFEHCGDIVKLADDLGYQNILLPSGWVAGQDALGFAFSMAVRT